MTSPRIAFPLLLLVCAVCGSSAKVGGWDTAPNTQYHIQTDEGPERYFKYQTISGQYRKERRLQDGSVVGTYGWVDANGLLRLRDYVADNKGYRIVRTKTVHVGTATPIASAVSAAKKVPSQGGVGVESTTQKPAPLSLSDYLKEQTTPPSPISLSDYLKSPKVDIIHNAYPESTPSPTPSPYYNPSPPPEVGSTPAPYYASPTPSYVEPVTFRPFYNPNSLDYGNKLYESIGAGRYESAAAGSQQFSQYDGVAFTHNGFRYYLPRHYHEEENLPGDSKAGSFGYIDPFGIRRVIYYNASPGGGFVHRKNNRYVGFQATPYDPRY